MFKRDAERLYPACFLSELELFFSQTLAQH